MDSNNTIRTDRCDSCHVETACAVFHHYGTPVLAECRHCNPRSFEDVARRDVDRWLSGGRP